MKRLLLWAVRLGLVAAIAGLLVPVALYFSANGLTVGGLVFFGIPLGLGFLLFQRPKLCGAVVVAQLLFVGWRLVVVPHAPEGWRFCEANQCGRGPWWSYLAPEKEAVLAGLELSHLVGIVQSREYQSFRSTFGKALPGEQGLPNPLLVWSREGSVQTLVHVPAGKTRAPCIVFLHGFGGLLTGYLQVMADSALGQQYVLVAPALDPIGAWGSERGEAVVREVLASLPPEADRERVFLIGLSNGSIHGARYAPLFRGAVLISGGGTTVGGHLLAISGTDDVRIPMTYVRNEVEQLKGEGVDIALHELPVTTGSS